MNTFRKTMTAAGLAGVALLAVVGTSAALGGDTGQKKGDVPWCTGSDLDVNAYDAHAPNDASKLFRIAFTAKDGVNCKIGGTLSNVQFIDDAGQDIGADLTVPPPGEYVELPVDADHEAAIYVSTQLHGPRLNPASIRFDLPGQGSLGDSVTVAWPSGLGALVTVTDFMAPVS
ncbi:hypothetical protein ACIA8G_09345 [Lentzea sp. NPDC051213]|uniref:hypothetical protein n=1 Tax=Lentzea sp. NPDC051213 TaxID=3364126 RepID=UPI0037A0B438